MTLPSYYLGRMDRKKQLSDEVSGDMDKASAGIMATTDMLSKLQAKMDSDKLTKDKTTADRELKSRALDASMADKRADRDIAERGLVVKETALARDDERADAAAKEKASATDREQKTKDVSDYVRAGRRDGLSMMDILNNAINDPKMLDAGQNVAAEVARQEDEEEKRDATIAATNRSNIPKPTREKTPEEIARQGVKDELARAQLEALKGKGGKATQEDTDGLRREFNMLPEVKAMKEADIAKQKIVAASKAKTPAGDLTLLYSFNKLLDPGSVVKETELATAAAAGAIDDRVASYVLKVTNGERLTDAQRADLVAQAMLAYNAQKSQADAAIARYGSLATKRGGSAEDVTGVGAGPGEDRATKLRQRVSELKAQGMTKDQAREVLRQEGLIQ